MLGSNPACDDSTFDQGLAPIQRPRHTLPPYKLSHLRIYAAGAKPFGDAITYVVNRNINSQIICFLDAVFADLARVPGRPMPIHFPRTNVVRQSPDVMGYRATEVCIQGGLPRDLDWLFSATFARLKLRHSSHAVHAFSPRRFPRRR